jgi:peptidoglycan/xylan/chitin deacetylase (PgdA/CDA1 family)
VALRDRHRDVLVLCYHAVSERWNDALAVTPQQLAAQVGELIGRGYVATTFSEAVLDPPAARTLAISFDDACGSVLRRAKPVLDGLGAPATVFAPSGWIGEPTPMRWAGIEHHAAGPHADELACLGWDELRSLADGGWEVGSHTVSHPHLSAIDDEALERELRASREALEAGLQRSVLSIAYPYGDVDARVMVRTRDAGYLAAAGLPARPGEDDAWSWPRVGIYHRDDQRRFRTKVAPAVRAVRKRVGR